MTKNKLKTVLLAVLLLLPVGLCAQQTLTVCNGTSTSSYIPMYGYYNDSRFHNEFVYPARMLTDMVGGTITEITFYSQTASESWNSPLTLTIDLTGFAQGAYFVRITGEHRQAIRKLIVK